MNNIYHPNGLEIIHASDLPNTTPEHWSFISYIINSYIRSPFEDLNCRVVDVPFGKAKATAVFQYAKGKEIIEFWFVVDKDNKPMALAQRVLVKGVLDENSIGFTQFVMRPYHQKCVLQAIKDIPHLETELE